MQNLGGKQSVLWELENSQLAHTRIFTRHILMLMRSLYSYIFLVLIEFKVIWQYTGYAAKWHKVLGNFTCVV